MNKYVLTVKNIKDIRDKKHFVATKAVADITIIANEIGFKNITRYFADIRYTSSIMDVFFIIRLLFLPKNSKILYQHPIYFSKIIKKLFSRVMKAKNFEVITIIHDLEMLRNKRNQMHAESEELEILNISDFIIAHNGKMKSFLEEKGVESDKIIELEIFDYLLDKTSNVLKEDPISNKSLIVAGNLLKNKCGYLYELIDKNNCYLDIYGINYIHENNISKYVKYHGAFPASKLPYVLSGGYGLVWDGDSVDVCTGLYGEYLKYNNPHKFSLYLVSGIPVIVWKKSAIADFVIKNNLGYAVENIYEAIEIINRTDEEDYNQMKDNAKKIGVLLEQGYFFKKAMNCIHNI